MNAAQCSIFSLACLSISGNSTVIFPSLNFTTDTSFHLPTPRSPCFLHFLLTFLPQKQSRIPNRKQKNNGLQNADR
jgi:hypothetical protein